MYLKVIDGIPVEWPIQEFQIRSYVYPQNLPDVLTLELLQPMGFEIYEQETPPKVDTRVQQLKEGTPIKVKDGYWKSNWQIVELFSPEEKLQQLNKLEASYVRVVRDDLLKKSDWTQLTDYIPDPKLDKAAWAAYRQELRDITQQTGFPSNVVWPTPPALAPQT